MNIGALPSQDIAELIEYGFIVGAQDAQINPSSLDLSISDEIYEVRGAFQVPFGSTVYSVVEKMKRRKLTVGEPLIPGKSYVVRIVETIDLPSAVYGYANPKSTTGRLDIHAKLLADKMPQNDALRKGFKGDLWLYIKPQSFFVLLPPGTPLTQVRLFYSDARLQKADLEKEMNQGLLFEPIFGKRIAYKDMQLQDSADSIILTLNAKSASCGDAIGYVAKKTKEVIDYNGTYDRDLFFEAIYPNKTGFINIKPRMFYILSSSEWLSVPPHLACEMVSIDDRFGEFRSHYAGYIDPGWGWKRGVFGRPLTLEVRSFENLFVRHGQPIARIKFERLADTAEMLYDENNSNYTKQFAAKLAKQFV